MPFIPYNSAGGESGSLVGTYQYKINQGNGALELWKGTEKIAEQNSDGSWFKTAVSTGVGSLHLGGGESSDPAHSVSSSGQNVVFKNESHNATPGAAMIWFPAWQGLRRDLGGTPAIPTFLQFGNFMSAYEPNGSAHGSNIVGYDFITTIPLSIVASSLQVVAGETYSGKVTNIILSDPKGVELHSTSATVNVTAGQLFTLEYPSLFFARNGDSLRFILKKENGQVMQVRGGLINTALPYRRIASRSFSDVPVGDRYIGDIKDFYGVNDHGGWIYMDGRPVSSLTQGQRDACATLNIITNIPDARDRFVIGNGGSYNSGNKAGSTTIARSALPNVTLTGTTDGGTAHKHSAGGLTTQAGTGNHEHTYQQMGTRNASGTDFVVGNGSNNNSASTTGTGAHTHTVVGDTATESSHTHTFTTTSMNGNVTQTAHLPPLIAFGKFIYLGL
jgi:hypothetical protein